MRTLTRIAVLMVCFIGGNAFAAGGACPSGVPSGVTNCYFIAANGSDSNSGASESSPWAHMPGMRTCTGNCASTTPGPGDGFILRGCDSWGNSNFEAQWIWSGNSTSPIYIGVDPTWYNSSSCSSGWNRPIFDAQQSDVSPDDYVFNAAYGKSTSYVTLDNIEFKNLHCNGTCSEMVSEIACTSACSNWTFEHLYIHAWNIPSDNNCRLVQLSNSPGNSFTYSIIDGSDRSGESPAGGTCYGFYPIVPGTLAYNVLHDLTNAVVGWENSDPDVLVHDNRIYNGLGSNSGTNHPNLAEQVGGSPWVMYNNTLYNEEFSGGIYIFTCGETLAFNNVIYAGGSSDTQPPITIDDNCGNLTQTSYIYNNTFQSPAAVLIRVNGRGTSGIGPMVVKNNHWINSNGSTSTNGTGAVCYAQSSCDPVASYTETNSVVMTNSAATNAGYTAAEAYPYAPPSGSSATVNVGANLASDCGGLFSALCHDTTVACTQQTLKGVVQVVCPTRAAIGRPSTGAGNWDSGAYQYSSATASGPNPPTSLTVSVH